MRTTKFSIQVIVLLALFYNAILAFINANLFKLSFTIVALTELLILFFGALLIAQKIVFDTKTKFIIGFFLFFIALNAWNCVLSLLGGYSISAKPLRDLAIIFIFLLLGYICANRRINPNTMVILAASLVAFFLLLELLRTDIYIKLLNVSSYYANTREVSQALSDTRLESGLFYTAMSYEGRFTFGFRQAQRLSSLFLEQTTHANFSVVLMIYLMGFWNALSHKARIILAGTATLIVLGTDSRQAFAVALILAAGYHIFPKLNRTSLAIYMPAVLFFMFVFFYDPNLVHRTEDDVDGRLSYSVSRLFSVDLEALLGLRMAQRVFDSGYTYLLYTQSALGLLGFWVFLWKILPTQTPEGKRVAHSVMLFYTLNLAVSGSTIFSIKTAGLMWFIVGYFVATEALLARQKLSADSRLLSDSGRTTLRPLGVS